MATYAVRSQSKKAFAVETAALRYVDIVSEALGERLPQSLPPPPTEPLPFEPSPDGLEPETVIRAVSETEAPPAPDWVVLQNYIAYQLRVARQRLLAASYEREREVHDDPEARSLRDEAVRAGYEQLVRTRQALRATIGDDATLKILGVEGSTPQQPDTLLESLQEAVFHLRTAETGDIELLLPWMPPDWDGLIADLDASAVRLADAIRAVELGNRDASGALVERERIHSEIRGIVTGLTQMLEGIYRLAGRADLADRIRPTTPSPSSAEESEVPGSGSGEGTDGGGPPDGPRGPNGTAIPIAALTGGDDERKEVVPVVAVLPEED